MSAWVVTVQWNGRPEQIQSLLTALLHLQPSVVTGEPAVKVTVRANDGPAAEEYVVRLLVREGLDSRASTRGADPAGG